MKKGVNTSLVLFGFGLLLSAGLYAQSHTDLFDFDCQSGGCVPTNFGRLTQGLDGNLYGTSLQGGRFNWGTIFMVTTSGAHTDLWSFDEVSGAEPFGGLTLASDGSFYGTTTEGGTYHDGTVFRFTPPNTFTVLHSFSGSDGNAPDAPPTQAADGNLYGVTSDGFTYRIELPSGTFQQLPNNVVPLSGCFLLNCEYVTAPLYLASDGNLYGTSATGGGTFGVGSVFRMTTDGDITNLYSFTGVSDGALPRGPLTQGQGADTALYGTTWLGGTFSPVGAGTLFRVTLEGVFTSLHSFDGTVFSPPTNIEGEQPRNGLVAASDGFLYGANTFGGTNGAGTLYKATTTGSSFKKFFDFPGPGFFGGGPWTTLMQHTNGTLYGLSIDGSHNAGTFYSVTPVKPIPILKIAGPIFVLPGVPVQFLGNNLTQAFEVTLGGEQMPFQANADTYLTAQVPNDAVDGVVTVTLESGLQIATQSAIHILPTITNFDPQSGQVGTQMTIVGGGLAGTTRVMVGAVKANFAVIAPNVIQAIVPPGTEGGQIKIATPNGSTISVARFIVN